MSITDAMRSFSHHKDADSIPLTVWIEARDAVTTAIRTLDIDARLKFIDLLQASLKTGKNPRVEFVTLFASIILISTGLEINGNLGSRKSEKDSMIFKVDEKEPFGCKRNNVLIHFSKSLRLKTWRRI